MKRIIVGAIFIAIGTVFNGCTALANKTGDNSTIKTEVKTNTTVFFNLSGQEQTNMAREYLNLVEYPWE